MTNQEYVTGQRFKAKIQGVEVEGRIYVVEQDEIYLCQNIVRGVDDSPENFGYKHSWISNPKLSIDVTDLILLPDPEFDKDNWVVNIEKEKDHPRVSEFKEWYELTTNDSWDFKCECYGFKNGEAEYFSNYGRPTRTTDPPKISLDMFFTYFAEAKEEKEPQKGDAVEVSDDGETWLASPNRIFTGGRKQNGAFIIENDFENIYAWKHIRLAKPIPTERELAKQKAEKFMREEMPWWEGQSYGEHSKVMSALTEYILKTQKS